MGGDADEVAGEAVNVPTSGALAPGFSPGVVVAEVAAAAGLAAGPVAAPVEAAVAVLRVHRAGGRRRS